MVTFGPELINKGKELNTLLFLYRLYFSHKIVNEGSSLDPELINTVQIIELEKKITIFSA